MKLSETAAASIPKKMCQLLQRKLSLSVTPTLHGALKFVAGQVE